MILGKIYLGLWEVVVFSVGLRTEDEGVTA